MSNNIPHWSISSLTQLGLSDTYWNDLHNSDPVRSMPQWDAQRIVSSLRCTCGMLAKSSKVLFPNKYETTSNTVVNVVNSYIDACVSIGYLNFEKLEYMEHNDFKNYKMYRELSSTYNIDDIGTVTNNLKTISVICDMLGRADADKVTAYYAAYEKVLFVMELKK